MLLLFFIDIQCDSSYCMGSPFAATSTSTVHRITGQSWIDCKKKARGDGWIFIESSHKAYCPQCASKRRATLQ
ncbi:hypothetical protein RCH05_004083 [Janthinobacterium sp. CAN_S7]